MKNKLISPRLRWLTLRIIVFILLVIIVKSFLFSLYYIPSESMNPTLKNGNIILVSKFLYRLRFTSDLPLFSKKFSQWSLKSFSNPHHDDIVVFYKPESSIKTLSDEDKNKLFIKRVIGIPTDSLIVTTNSVFVNDEYFPIPTYYSQLAQGKFDEERKIKIPNGYYFLVGDNTKNSFDSRYFGLVNEENFVGKAEAIVWPWPPRWIE